MAETSEEQLLAEAKAQHEACQPGLGWELGTGPALFRQLLARKAAITAKGTGPINVGYVVYLARQKSRRPDLKLGADWQAGLAERCTTDQLAQLRDTLVNRINAVEGIGDSAKRNNKQRSASAKKARNPKELDDRRW